MASDDAPRATNCIIDNIFFFLLPYEIECFSISCNCRRSSFGPRRVERHFDVFAVKCRPCTDDVVDNRLLSQTICSVSIVGVDSVPQIDNVDAPIRSRAKRSLDAFVETGFVQRLFVGTLDTLVFVCFSFSI